jgi:hypothetical protein
MQRKLREVTRSATHSCSTTAGVSMFFTTIKARPSAARALQRSSGQLYVIVVALRDAGRVQAVRRSSQAIARSRTLASCSSATPWPVVSATSIVTPLPCASARRLRALSTSR